MGCVLKLAVLLICLHLSTAVLHSLKYVSVTTSGISDFPEFIMNGVVDNMTISHYDSNTKSVRSKTQWMKANVDLDYWDRETIKTVRAEQAFRNNMNKTKNRFHHRGGVHVLQYEYGCHWDDESGRTDGYEQLGYDGEDYLTLDMQNLRWISNKPQATMTKDKLNSLTSELQAHRYYLLDYCIVWLKKYVHYGRDILGRKVPPEVSVYQRDSRVACHATGFYPDGVMITWKRDGEEMQVDVGETLPNMDGTFQKRAVLTVSPEERRKGQYTCEVAHKSGEPITKTLIEEDGNTLGIMIGCVIAALVVMYVLAGFVMMKKKKDYKKTEQSDTDSDNSNPIARKGAECGDC